MCGCRGEDRPCHKKDIHRARGQEGDTAVAHLVGGVRRGPGLGGGSRSAGTGKSWHLGLVAVCAVWPGLMGYNLGAE